MTFKLGPEYRKASSAFREVSIYSISLVTRLYIYDSLVEWGEPLNGVN